MKLHKQLFFTLLACLFFATSYAERDHVLKLKSGEETLEALSSDQTLSAQFENISSDYAVIQFYQVPTQKQKDRLEAN